MIFCYLPRLAPYRQAEVVGDRAQGHGGSSQPKTCHGYVPHPPAFMQVKHSAHHSILRDYLD